MRISVAFDVTDPLDEEGARMSRTKARPTSGGRSRALADPDLKQIGRELGIRYVFEGSVRKAGNRIRIAGQLMMLKRVHIYGADRLERALQDMFDLQDHVTSSIVRAIGNQVSQAQTS
jgi:TolB-like protein